MTEAILFFFCILGDDFIVSCRIFSIVKFTSYLHANDEVWKPKKKARKRKQTARRF